MISVVIPVYNVADYLDECLSSVASQSYQDWECILVDDGSTDASGEICDNWSQKDSRFRVIHQTNKGVSAARNTGIECTSGEYFVFIDSDDWVGQNYLDHLAKGVDIYPGALIVSGINHVSNNDGVQEINVKETVHYCLGGDISVIKDNIGLLYSPCAKLFSKKIVESHEIKFPDKESLGEDLVFVFRYLRACFDICFLAVSDYYYRVPDGGSLSTGNYGNRFYIHYPHWQFQCEVLKENGIWSEDIERLFGSKLWGIVYEGLFMTEQLEYSTVRNIVEIEETNLLCKYADDFNCSIWIKNMVLKKRSFILYLILLFRNHIS